MHRSALVVLFVRIYVVIRRQAKQTRKNRTEKKNYAGSEKHSPHEYQEEERSNKETGVPASNKQEHQAQTLQSYAKGLQG
jgi:hypothetical protein